MLAGAGAASSAGRRSPVRELQSLDDHPLPGLQALGDEPHVADRPIGHDGTQFDLVVGVDDQGGRVALLIVRDGQLRHQYRIGAPALDDLLTHEHARQEQPVGVGEQRAQGHRTGRRIDGDFRELQLAGELVVRAILGTRCTCAWLSPDCSSCPAAAPASGAAAPRWLGHIDVDRVQLPHGASDWAWSPVTSAPRSPTTAQSGLRSGTAGAYRRG